MLQHLTQTDATSKFKVVIKNNADGTSMSDEHDRRVQAGGKNCHLEDPVDAEDELKECTGKMLHSSEAYEDIGAHEKGETVMMIGDNSSAEDLTLRCQKLGAKKVYVCARSGQGGCV